jgi:hypothetical protein
MSAAKKIAVEFEVYTSGLCYMSVCTNLADKTAVEDHANATNPAGTRHGWKVTEPFFRTGQTNPCACNNNTGKYHWLLTC